MWLTFSPLFDKVSRLGPCDLSLQQYLCSTPAAAGRAGLIPASRSISQHANNAGFCLPPLWGSPFGRGCSWPFCASGGPWDLHVVFSFSYILYLHVGLDDLLFRLTLVGCAYVLGTRAAAIPELGAGGCAAACGLWLPCCLLWFLCCRPAHESCLGTRLPCTQAVQTQGL